MSTIQRLRDLVGLRRPNAEREVARLTAKFDADPEYQHAKAVAYVQNFRSTSRRHYWSAPDGLFTPDRAIASTFSTIYERGVWGDGSGGGSELGNAALYVAYLQHFIEKNRIKTIVDLGCGDWRLMRHVDLTGVAYLGVDVVPSVIAANQAKYGSDAVTFQAADVTSFPAPTCDLLLCKDVLQHLSNANAAAVLSRTSRSRFSLITNDYSPANDDNLNGDTRPLDITRAPFAVRTAEPRLAYDGKVTFIVRQG